MTEIAAYRAGLRAALVVVTILRVDAEREQKPTEMRRGRIAAYRRAYNEINQWLDDTLPRPRRAPRGWYVRRGA